jgi:hypothetical protein
MLALTEPLAQAGKILDLAVCTGAATVTVGSFFIVDGWGLLVGAGEFGGAVAYGASGVDPADLVNYAIQANNPLITPAVPTLAGASAGFISASTNYLNALSLVIQQVKNYEDTVDRLAGAQLVGTAQDVANQMLWLSQFRAALTTDYRLYQSGLMTWVNALQAEYPDYYNYTPTAADVFAMNTQEAAGNFPSTEQYWINAYALTSEQVGFCEECFKNATSGSTFGAGQISVGQALQALATPVPEPSYGLVLGISVGLAVVLSRRRSVC